MSAKPGEDRIGKAGRAVATETRRVRALERLIRAIKLRKAGCTRSQIAVALDMTPEGVKELFKTRRLRRVFRDPTPDDFARVRALWPAASAGETQRAETTKIGSVEDEHATAEGGDAQGEPA